MLLVRQRHTYVCCAVERWTSLWANSATSCRYWLPAVLLLWRLCRSSVCDFQYVGSSSIVRFYWIWVTALKQCGLSPALPALQGRSCISMWSFTGIAVSSWVLGAGSESGLLLQTSALQPTQDFHVQVVPYAVQRVYVYSCLDISLLESCGAHLEGTWPGPT